MVFQRFEWCPSVELLRVAKLQGWRLQSDRKATPKAAQKSFFSRGSEETFRSFRVWAIFYFEICGRFFFETKKPLQCSTLQWLGLICCANMYRVRSSSTDLLHCCQIYPLDPFEQYSSGKHLYIFLWKHLVKIGNAVVSSCPYLSFTCTLLGYNSSRSVIAISHNTAKRCRAQGERPNVFLRDHACSSPAE